MRTIKFRCWSTKRNPKMVYLPEDGSYSGRDLIGDSDWAVMQFTGLLDKNGKEIYEGDIVTNANGTTHFSDDDYSFPFKVTWSNAKNYTGFNVKKKHCKWYEVIGNIYESPKLLKPTEGEK